MEEKYELSEAFIDLLKERDVQEFAKKNTLEFIEAIFAQDFLRAVF